MADDEHGATRRDDANNAPEDREKFPRESTDAAERRDNEEAEQRRALSAGVVHGAVLKEGEEELERASSALAWSALAWSALAAGISMGFSLVTEGVLRNHLPDAPWRPLIAKFGYSIGFILVVLGRQRLYTEDTLTAVIPVLESKSMKAFVNMLRLWAVVLLANVVGAALFALFVTKTRAFTPELQATFVDMARDAARPDLLTMFAKAIPAGWLIAMIPWASPSAPQSRLWIALIFAYAVGVAEFSHIIAGTVDVLVGVFSGAISWGTFGVRFFLPTLVGNTIGGALFVATLGHAQVKSGEEAG
jgi:formate-nitrite transporter family protein